MKTWECFLPLCLLFLVSCRSISQDALVGKYQGPSFFENNNNLTLLDNGRFVFEWRSGLAVGTSRGTWQLRRGRVHLDSDGPVEPNPLRLIESKETGSDSLTIQIIDENGEGVPFAACGFYKDKELLGGCVADIDGNVRCRFYDFTAMRVSSVSCMAGTYQEKGTPADYYRFEFKPRGPYDLHFVKAKWRIDRKGRLHDPRMGWTPKYAPKYYEKTP